MRYGRGVQMKVSIQVVNYKTKKYLEPMLEGVFADLAGSGIEFEINVVDNDSGDDLTDLRNEYEDRRNVHFFFLKRNVGFGAGHNFLARKSRAEYLLVLNPDIQFLEKDTIARALDVLEGNEEAKVVGPKLMTQRGKAQEWDHGEFDRESDEPLKTFWKERDEAAEVAWVSGAFLMIERETFDEIGGFDEKFFLYKEEEDLCLRVIERGGKVIYEPGIKVMHYGSVVATKDEFMEESERYFRKKHSRSVEGNQ